MDFFIIDCETHIFPPMDDISYFPNFRKYLDGLQTLSSSIRAGKAHLSGTRDKASLSVNVNADLLIESMDEAGVDMACVVPEGMRFLSHGLRVRSTNGWVANEIAKYPERLIGVCNIAPISDRGVEDAIWELDYLVKERGFRACKLYPPEEQVPMNDRVFWPLYERINELGIPLFVHTGMNYVQPGNSLHCRPILLEDICTDFPEMTILAYHMGYPYNRELAMLAGKHKNLYIGTSLLPQFSRGGPREAQKLLGEAIVWAGIDRVIWGSDWSGTLSPMKSNVDFLKNIQISASVQADYNYPPLSTQDREKWAGLNLARVLGIDPIKKTKAL
jgi:uncharacterized protein